MNHMESEDERLNLIIKLKLSFKPCPFCGGEARLQTHVPPRGSVYPRMTLGCTKCPWVNVGEVKYTVKEGVVEEHNEKFPYARSVLSIENAMIMVATRWNTRAKISTDITEVR